MRTLWLLTLLLLSGCETPAPVKVEDQPKPRTIMTCVKTERRKVLVYDPFTPKMFKEEFFMPKNWDRKWKDVCVEYKETVVP